MKTKLSKSSKVSNAETSARGEHMRFAEKNREKETHERHETHAIHEIHKPPVVIPSTTKFFKKILDKNKLPIKLKANKTF